MEFDIVIIGGGLVGASLASALKNSGLKPGFNRRPAFARPPLSSILSRKRARKRTREAIFNF